MGRVLSGCDLPDSDKVWWLNCTKRTPPFSAIYPEHLDRMGPLCLAAFVLRAPTLSPLFITWHFVAHPVRYDVIFCTYLYLLLNFSIADE